MKRTQNVSFLSFLLIFLVISSCSESGGICVGGDCPSESEVRGLTAERWCNYYKTVCPCPKTKNHYLEFAALSGDKHAYRGEFPHMAAIGYGSKENIKWGCGGALVSEHFILTAAHCLAKDEIPAAWVRLGDLEIQDKQLLSTTKHGQTHPVIERIPHPGYKEPSKYNDIALLRIGPALETSANSTLSRSIHPACLQVKERDIYPTKATGWEVVQGEGEDQLLELLSVKLLIDENDECNKTFGKYVNTTDQLPKGIDDSLLCFGRRGYAEYVPCKGDFDGPLQSYYHDRSCLHTLLGVKSFGKSCSTNLPLAVYTPVPYFLEWIEEQVWKNREICALDAGHYGECLLIENCTHIQQLTAKGYTPVNCSIDQRESKVCCPSPYQKIWLPPPVKPSQLTNQKPPGQVTKQSLLILKAGAISAIGSHRHKAHSETSPRGCEKYEETLKSLVSPEIISEDKHYYPHLAYVGFKKLKSIWWQCTGTLVSENFVLTAAHCTSNSQCETAKWVRLGSQIFKSDARWASENGTVAGQVHPILEIIIHPEYRESSKLNDLALLKIGDPIESNASSTMSASIHPACLQVSERTPEKVSSAGVDSVGTSDIFMYDVLEANLTIVNSSNCNISTGNSTEEIEEVEKFFTCTKVDSWSGFCLFSLEGPLHTKIDDNSSLYEVSGLTSNQSCQNITFTRLTPYLGWIEDHVWP